MPVSIIRVKSWKLSTSQFSTGFNLPFEMTELEVNLTTHQLVAERWYSIWDNENIHSWLEFWCVWCMKTAYGVIRAFKEGFRVKV